MDLGQIATAIGIENVEPHIAGITISAIAPIGEAPEGSLTFIANPSYERFYETTKAAAVLVSHDFEPKCNGPLLIRTKNPYVAFAKALAIFNRREPIFIERIAASAVVNPKAVIASSATIGANVVIAHNVEIGEETVIHPNCTIYDGVRIGRRCIIGPNTVIGFDGFGYARDEDGSYLKVPQTGGVVIEDDVEIGASCTIDRAVMADTIIHRGVKIDNLVQIAHNVEIGEDSVIAAQTGISGSAVIGKRNQIAGQAGLVGHIHTADDVTIIAQSGVSKSLAKSGIYQGSPAKEAHKAFRQEAAIRMLPDLLDRVRELETKLRELGK